MDLLEDTTQEILDYLSYEDVVSLKKSGGLDNLSDIKLREILSKKLLIKMILNILIKIFFLIKI